MALIDFLDKVLNKVFNFNPEPKADSGDLSVSQNNEPLDFSTSEIKQNDYDIYNLSSEDKSTLEIIDYEQYVIDELEEELIETKEEFEIQDDKDGIVNEIYNGVKEIFNFGISKSDVASTIEKQEIALEQLKQAKINGNFEEVYEQITGNKYDEEKLIECHNTEVVLNSMQVDLDNILNSNESDEIKQQKVNEYLVNFQNNTGLSYEQLASHYKEMSNQYLAGANELTNVLNSYVDSQENFIDKTAQYAQIGGLALTAVGAVCLFLPIPGAQLAAGGIMKAGQMLSLGGMFGDNIAQTLDTATNKQSFEEDKQEYKEIAKETIIDTALYLSGRKAGDIGNAMGAKALERFGSKAIAKVAEIGADATLSLASDALITGEVDLKGEGLSQLLGVLTGLAGSKIQNMKTDVPDVKIETPMIDNPETPKFSFNPETGELSAPKVKSEIEPAKLDYEVSGDSVGMGLKNSDSAVVEVDTAKYKTFIGADGKEHKVLAINLQFFGQKVAPKQKVYSGNVSIKFGKSSCILKDNFSANGKYYVMSKGEGFEVFPEAEYKGLKDKTTLLAEVEKSGSMYRVADYQTIKNTEATTAGATLAAQQKTNMPSSKQREISEIGRQNMAKITAESKTPEVTPLEQAMIDCNGDITKLNQDFISENIETEYRILREAGDYKRQYGFLTCAEDGIGKNKTIFPDDTDVNILYRYDGKEHTIILHHDKKGHWRWRGARDTFNTKTVERISINSQMSSQMIQNLDTLSSMGIYRAQDGTIIEIKDFTPFRYKYPPSLLELNSRQDTLNLYFADNISKEMYDAIAEITAPYARGEILDGNDMYPWVSNIEKNPTRQDMEVLSQEVRKLASENNANLDKIIASIEDTHKAESISYGEYVARKNAVDYLRKYFSKTDGSKISLTFGKTTKTFDLAKISSLGVGQKAQINMNLANGSNGYCVVEPKFEKATTLDEAVKFATEQFGITSVEGFKETDLDILNWANEGLFKINQKTSGTIKFPEKIAYTKTGIEHSPAQMGCAGEKRGTLEINSGYFSNIDKEIERVLQASKKQGLLIETNNQIELSNRFKCQEFQDLLTQYQKGQLSIFDKIKFGTILQGVYYEKAMMYGNLSSYIRNYAKTNGIPESKFKNLLAQIQEIESREISVYEEKVETNEEIKVKEERKKKIREEKLKILDEFIEQENLTFDILAKDGSHNIYHELGHWNDPIYSEDYGDRLATKMTREQNWNKNHRFSISTAFSVSPYPAIHDSSLEYIAEFFARAISGEPLSDEAWRLYRQLNGPEIPNYTP